MLNRLREKFQRFMIGRYGMDQLGQFMVSAVLVVIVVNLFVRAALPSMILNMLELAGLFAMYVFKECGTAVPGEPGISEKAFLSDGILEKGEVLFCGGTQIPYFQMSWLQPENTYSTGTWQGKHPLSQVREGFY